MIRIPLPGEDSALLLLPQWGWVALVVLLVPIVLAAWLYRYELRLVPRFAAGMLFVIRLAVLVSLLSVVFLQPVIARRWTEERSGKVIVAVDRSKSMDFPDPQRTELEKLRLARAFKTSDEMQLERWIKALEAGSRIEPAEQAALEKAFAAVDGWTRAQIVERTLTGDLGLLKKLVSRFPVEVKGFARTVQPATLDLPLPPASGQLFTDLGNVLKGDSANRILGVVLLSDGQHNFGPPPLVKARELADQKVPIYPIAIGAPRPPPDVAVREVKAPANTFADAESTVEARVHVTGLPAGEIRVELHEHGKPLKPDLVQRIPHDGGDRVYPVRFQVKLREVGTHRFEVKANLESKANEISRDNNVAPAITGVLRDKAKVLLVDAEPRWEYQYLATLLSRDKDIAADRVLLHQPRIGMIKGDKLKALDFPLTKLPEPGPEGDPLLSYECILLGDLLPSELPPSDRTRLERYVSQAGGTLVLIAGKRGMPLAFSPSEPDPFVKLLPISAPRLAAPEKGFKLELTSHGQTAAFLQLDGSIKESLKRWAELPSSYWSVGGKPKPGATVLARRGASEDGIIVEQHYGFGRVVYVGIDSTWRWRYRVGDIYHHRFWGQLIRSAAANKLWPAGNKYVRYGTRDPAYSEGKEVLVGVRLSHEVALPKEKAVARVVRKSPDGKESTVADIALSASELQPRLLEGRINDLQPGEYRVELDIPELKDRITAADDPATFTVLPPESTELTDLAANWTLLENLAVQTKGELLTAETATRVLELLESRIERIEHRSDTKVWQDAPAVWITLTILLSLLTIEWSVRKWVGLP